MNSLSLVAVALMLLSVIGSFYLGAISVAEAKEIGSEPEPFLFTPLYYFKSGDLLSYFSALFFAFIFSLLFFGFGSVLAGILEGLKFGSILVSTLLLESSQFVALDVLFIVPQILAILAGASLGQSVIEDYQSKGNLSQNLLSSAKYLVAAVVLTTIFYFVVTSLTI